MIAVSVPVKDEAGRMVASLAMHAPVFRMTLQAAKAHVGRLREAAKRLGDELRESKEGISYPPADSRRSNAIQKPVSKDCQLTFENSLYGEPCFGAVALGGWVGIVRPSGETR